MRFTPDFLDELRARVPVSEVVRKKVKLRKEGREWRGLSPFNAEKTPSFYVNDQKGFFHDFSSGKHGDGIAFVMETEGVSFPEAVARVAAMAGVPLPEASRAETESEHKRASLTGVMGLAAQFFQKQLKEAGGREARDYLSGREISAGSQTHFGLGFAPAARYALRDELAAKGVGVEAMIETGLLIHGPDIPVPYDRFRNRIMFPICDRAGRVIAFGGRALEKDAQGPSDNDGRRIGRPVAKYLNSPDTTLFHKGATLYNLHNARTAAHEMRSAFVVEGYVDVIAMTAAGFPNTVAPLGTALTEEQLALLWRMAEEPVLCFDGDKAGLKAAHRAIETALPLIGPGASLRFALLPAGQDPDELLRASGPASLQQALSAPLPLIEMLWRRETQDVPLDTPERRAALERRLKEVADQIKDQALRRHYGRELFARLAKLWDDYARPERRGFEPKKFAPRGPQGFGFRRAGESAGPVRIGSGLANSPLFTGEKSSIPPRECLILLIFLNHPELLGDHVEDLAGLEFSSRDANALRRLLVSSAADGGESANAGSFLAQSIEEAGLAPFRARLEGMVAHANLFSVRCSADSADAAASLRQALALHRKVSALNRELKSVEERLAADPTEEDDARLKEIQRHLMTLDGTEAALEGFGLMSGRAGRTL